MGRKNTNIKGRNEPSRVPQCPIPPSMHSSTPHATTLPPQTPPKHRTLLPYTPGRPPSCFCTLFAILRLVCQRNANQTTLTTCTHLRRVKSIPKSVLQDRTLDILSFRNNTKRSHATFPNIHSYSCHRHSSRWSQNRPLAHTIHKREAPESSRIGARDIVGHFRNVPMGS